jgi:hypothetical protein
MVECTLDGQRVPPRAFMRRSMNFGQPVSGQPARAYQVLLDLEELARVATPLYDRCMRELEADEPFDDHADPVVNALRAGGFAPLAQALVVDPTLVARALRRLLALEILDALFPHEVSEASRPYYWLNTLDHVAIDASGAKLAGVAFDGATTAPSPP